uniref:Apple domain-containing protein n=1 Tax=Anopheles atroparvus TaxID=41427 RepID=A0AAG5DRB9_ANOAO
MTEMERKAAIIVGYQLGLILLTATFATAIQIDNRLVQPQYDCFERIALGAMLPFEKTFRNSDTNSLKICETLCLNDKECQTFAFGISGRGNGTCQLSANTIDNTNSRPVGTIFDPDFDLYSRKYNCFLDGPTNPPPKPGGLGIFPNGELQPGGGPQRQPPPPPPPPPTGSAFPPPSIIERPGPPVFGPPVSAGGIDSPTTSNGGFVEPSRPTGQFGGTATPVGSTSPGTTYGQTEEALPETTAPAEEFYSTKDHSHSTQNGGSPYHPTSTAAGPQYSLTAGERLPPTQPAGTIPDRENPTKYPLDLRPQYGSVSGPGTGGGAGGPSKPGNYPYHYPMLYETNYPLPNNKNGYPEIYAQNVPTLDNNYLRPEYGGTSFGRPSGPSGATPSIGSGNGASGYGGAQRPSSSGSTGYGTGSGGPIQRPPPSGPSAYGGQVGRPSAPATGNAHSGYGVVRPGPAPPVIQSGPSAGGGYNVHEDKLELHPSTPSKRPCYRRVLAGKRVAPHWVRRTLICERVEDCQRECGDERRFSCEGFNYRLDPTGRGQGDCELIDQPLSQIDLYSSPHQRDSNLIRDPDYDYYERDRSATANCRPSCKDCMVKPFRPALEFIRPTTYRPHHPENYKPYPSEPHPYDEDRYKPPITAIDKYRPPMYARPPEFDRYSPSSSYYPPPPPPPPLPSPVESYRPSISYKPQYGSEIDRYGTLDHGFFKVPYDRHEYPKPLHHEDIRPVHRPRHPYEDRDSAPPPAGAHVSTGQQYGHKPNTFIPYLIGQNIHKNGGVYGGSYGPSFNTDSYKSISDYWGLRNEIKRYDSPSFNYFELRNDHHFDDNNVWSYGGSKYGYEESYPSAVVPFDRDHHQHPYGEHHRVNFGQQWIRRPSHEECSVKSSEGFRLHKGVVKYALNTPTVVECERMCYSESRFRCHTFSYRYSAVSRENCLLCDRPFNLLDFYADLEPDRDYDIYSMSDDAKTCHPEPGPPRRDYNAQCFIRVIDSARFFKSIVRDSLTVRSIGECELECIKATKFTCRAFTYSFGPNSINAVIDNCQLSDWPVRDMDKDRHLVPDETFDVFERASYGQGCEIQPIIDDKHNKKFCYLGYGSPAKLLSSAIKKVTSVNTELDCKNECIRLRESTHFKCLSFSFSSQASTYNCEMSDLDQSELKLGVHYAHTNDRDFWLFAWNPFDYTCRDKITTISSGSTTRMNHDRRIDIFREPGDGSWRQYTVSGKPCRLGTKCERNKITGFYSCEIEGGEIGSWDYCCKAEHPCGYSQGFDYPWCYVGDAPDQWRKCSDKYFPKKQHDSRYQNKNKKGEIYQPPPKPGGLRHLDDVTAPAELWPVTYLYEKGPPNATEISSNVIDCKKDKC